MSDIIKLHSKRKKIVETRIKIKTAKQLERHFKGVANHHRIDILLLVSENPNITVDGIAERLNKNFKTISEHTRRLSGLNQSKMTILR